jgi:hypothetical protein
MNSSWWRRWAAPLGLLMAAVVCGCSGGTKAPANAEVSGKVTYKGQPVPGGEVVFVTVNGGFANGAMMDENGEYKITAPVGDVKITVSNSMLRTGGRGAPRGGGGGMLKRPDSEQPKEAKGRYIDLPSKYANADLTDLTYTVVKGTQTHNIELK